jgi:signal transduction histidine kinase
LVGASVSMLLSPGIPQTGRQDSDAVTKAGTVVRYEQDLIRKDKTTATIEIGVSLINSDGQPSAFQNVARDITEKKRAQDNLRFYVQQVSQAQEAERKRIARELHDDTAQALVAVLRNLEDLSSDHPRYTAEEIRAQLRAVLRGVRNFSQQLRPSVLDDLGLLPALNWLAADLSKNYGIVADVKVLGETRHLSSDAELMLFRITQEALNNVQRHAQATAVHVNVEFSDRKIKVTICDDGKGFVMPSHAGDLARFGKLGLAGIQERTQLLAGNVTIDTAPGKGTTLTVEVPL